MKRGKPLKRTPLKRGDSQLKKTPLKRGDSTLKSSSQLNSNTPINKRSKKMSATYVKRRKLVKDRLGEGTECEACMAVNVFHRIEIEKVRSWSDKPSNRSGIIMTKQAVDVHEIINRSQGGDILDEKILLNVCRDCHIFITENPFNSSLLGLHLSGSMYEDEYIAEAKRVRDSWSKGIPAVPEYLELSDEHEENYNV
tara:strand:+ start:446 stop:1036 length:591 start_codon:yes stop_codon:yes gene_type:complete